MENCNVSIDKLYTLLILIRDGQEKLTQVVKDLQTKNFTSEDVPLNDAARELGISRRKMLQLKNSERLTHIKIGKSFLFKRKELDRIKIKYCYTNYSLEVSKKGGSNDF